MLEILCWNHKRVSDYSVSPHVAPGPHCPNSQGFWKGKAYFAGGLLSCWNDFFFFPYWDSLPTWIIRFFSRVWMCIFSPFAQEKERIPPWKGRRLETRVHGSLWYSYSLLLLLDLMTWAMANTVTRFPMVHYECKYRLTLGITMYGCDNGLFC